MWNPSPSRRYIWLSLCRTWKRETSRPSGQNPIPSSASSKVLETKHNFHNFGKQKIQRDDVNEKKEHICIHLDITDDLLTSREALQENYPEGFFQKIENLNWWRYYR